MGTQSAVRVEVAVTPRLLADAVAVALRGPEIVVEVRAVDQDTANDGDVDVSIVTADQEYAARGRAIIRVPSQLGESGRVRIAGTERRLERCDPISLRTLALSLAGTFNGHPR